MKTATPKQQTMAFIAASLLRLDSAATLTEIQRDLAEHDVVYAPRVVRVYLQRMHAEGMIDKYDIEKRGSVGECVSHGLTVAGRKFLSRWLRSLSVPV